MAVSIIVGRKTEKAQLQRAVESSDAALIAVYGRRRVGKTFLIREYLEPKTRFFTVTGEHQATLQTQLYHFKTELETVFYDGAPLPVIRSWRDAFAILASALEHVFEKSPNAPITVFLDELPWLSTRRSGLLPALDHVWNTRLSRMGKLVVVLCGSAASWMLDKLIHAKGGLHNRVTGRIALDPFSLEETYEFLRSQRSRVSQRHVLEAYMVLGGVPHYLAQLPRGKSVQAGIADLCFSRNGLLQDEFPRLFKSLFESSDQHELIVRALATTGQGLTKQEIASTIGATSGGRLVTQLGELEAAGFIGRFIPWGRRTRGTTYRLIDEYCGFYLKWIESAPKGVLAKGGEAFWANKLGTPSWHAWAGFAFEAICLKHASSISQAMGIAAATPGTWRYVPAPHSSKQGAQVDLLFDDQQGTIYLCEVKFSTTPFVVDKRYAAALKRKLDVFSEHIGSTNEVLLWLITAEGMKRNAWSEDLVDGSLSIRDILEA